MIGLGGPDGLGDQLWIGCVGDLEGVWIAACKPEGESREIWGDAADDGGAVVLLHSHDRGEDRHRFVLAATEQLLQTARDYQMRICTMSELLGDSTIPSQREVHGGTT